MRILCLSNFYPPAGRGGYELWCQEVTERLRCRGHEVVVLTSNHRRAAVPAQEPDWIVRDLHLEMDLASLRNGIQFFTSRKARLNENLAHLQKSIEQFKPDIALVWGMWNLSRWLPTLAEELLPGRVAYYIGDYWPTLPEQFEAYWQAPARNLITAIPKTVLKPLARRVMRGEAKPVLAFEHVIYPTVFMHDELRRRGLSSHHCEIVYGAINTQLYRCHRGVSDADPDLISHLLFAGRLSPEKGAHTAIEALSRLVFQLGFEHLRLTIVGSGEPAYEAYLQQLASDLRIEYAIKFIGAKPVEAMPAFYHQADIFLFTSIWPEPFGRVLVEAMASGVPVIGTATGGAAEILAAGKYGLVFAPDDPDDLALKVADLIESPSARTQLAESAQRRALERFDVNRMTGEIETVLARILGIEHEDTLCF